jgi:hypothetical protein
VVGDGDGWHFLPRRLVEQFRRFACSVEKAVISVNVQVDELRLTHGPRF